ncbi:MAG: hypothetical protein CM15mP122_5480 [Bacteroidota bacterium]|nr:MAG: hypothetical protein CM15mP122_5480 [Bacteroidota bacterium]
MQKFTKNVKKDCLLYLKPEWGKKEFIMSHVVKYIMQNPKMENFSTNSQIFRYT